MKKLFAMLPLVALFAACSSDCATTQDTAAKPQRKVAVQTYTMYKYPLIEVFKTCNDAGIDAVELCLGMKIGGQFPNSRLTVNSTPEEKAYVRSLMKQYNIKAISTGVNGAKTEADVVKLCEFAKEFNIPMISTEAPASMLPIWEKYCEKYGIKMGIHNHQNSKGATNNYYDYNVVAELIKPYKNIGAQPDNGGWSRSGLDCVKGIKVLEGKILSVHFKDQKTFGDLNSDAVIYGTGCVDLKGMLAELDRQGFDGYFIIEHGNPGDKPKIIAEDLKFLREN